MTELGVVFIPQLPPERLRSVVQAADQAGLDELWLWEDCFLESGIATAAAALAWSERLTVGIGVLPVPLRNVALTAMEIATISRLFPGRFRVGVGHGVQRWMQQVGAKAASPMTLLREQLTALQGLLAGERVTMEGRYVQLADVALDWPPTADVGLLAAASGPKTLELSGTLAAGTVLTGGTLPSGVAAARSVLDAARAAAGLPGRHRIVVYLMCATGAQASERVAAELAGSGLPVEAAVVGDPAEIAAGIRRWVEAGADTVVLQPTQDEPDMEGFVAMVAQQVKPLL